MKKLYILLLFVMACGFSAQAQQPPVKYYADTMLFAFGKHYVSFNHRAFDSLMSLLKDNPNYYIRIVGHTDTVGSDKMNMKLSHKRSQRVTNYLKARGLDSLRMESQWRGYHQPIATNKTNMGRRVNRRVNMYVIYAKDKLVQPKPEPKPEPKPVKKDTLPPPPPPKPIKKDTVPPPPPKPKLIIDTIFYDKDPVAVICDHQTIIFGPKGMKVTIPPKSLDCGEKFTFEIKEFFKPEDMVLGRMHTMTKKDLLDAQSILCLKAYNNGKPQNVKANSQLLVEMPSISRDKDARVYVTPGTGSFTWRQYTGGNDIPTYDQDYKRYNIGVQETGCISVAKKCSNKENKTYAIDVKLKRLYDKNPQVYYATKDLNSVITGRKDGSFYVIENICDPAPGTLVAVQTLEGEPFLAIAELTKKQTDKMRKKGRARVKMKFEPVTKEELVQRIKDAI